jgi:abequosyltransferase
MKPKLSICIPTYNFGEFIGETLKSIVDQAPPDLEIVVLDGASTDNTEEVVLAWKARFPALKYFRLPKRGGIDQDLAKSVDLASGDYCWLFSSDDVMRPDAIERLYERLNDACDVYVCEHSICDKSMRRLHDHAIFANPSLRVVEFSDTFDRRSCLADGMNTEALFSFMSGLIVRRSKWMSVQPPAEFLGSCWWHVARLLELSRSGLSVCYVPEVWLDKRGENDSFMDRGVVNRLRIAVDGFIGISTHFFGAGSAEAETVRRYLRNELLLTFFYARDLVIRSPELESRSELNRIFDLCYRDCGVRGLSARALFHLVPVAVYRGLKSVYKLVRGVARWFGGRGDGRSNA